MDMPGPMDHAPNTAGLWTPNFRNAIQYQRTREMSIDELLLDEGLRWRTQESWFGERAGLDGQARSESEVPTQRLDPQFAEKRGR